MVNNYGSFIYLRSGAEPSACAVKATSATLIARAASEGFTDEQGRICMMEIDGAYA